VKLASLHPIDYPWLVFLFADPGVRKYLGGPLSAVDAGHRAIQLIIGNDGAGKVWAIRPQAGEAAAGLVWLSPHHHGEDMELSIMLLPEWQGRGVARLAAEEALRIAFVEDRLPKVVAETQSANVSCRRLMEALGMGRVRVLERFGVEQSLYELTAEAWRERRQNA